MPNHHEQKFVDSFVSIANGHSDQSIAIGKIINAKCKAKKYADVEFISKSGVHWVIEAKTHESPDFNNAIHKIFGEFMKETGRSGRPPDVRYALLLPGEGLEKFGESLSVVNKQKFEAFGGLVPVSDVLYVEGGNIHRIPWTKLHGYKKDGVAL